VISIERLCRFNPNAPQLLELAIGTKLNLPSIDTSIRDQRGKPYNPRVSRVVTVPKMGEVVVHSHDNDPQRISIISGEVSRGFYFRVGASEFIESAIARGYVPEDLFEKFASGVYFLRTTKGDHFLGNYHTLAALHVALFGRSVLSLLTVAQELGFHLDHVGFCLEPTGPTSTGYFESEITLPTRYGACVFVGPEPSMTDVFVKAKAFLAMDESCGLPEVLALWSPLSPLYSECASLLPPEEGEVPHVVNSRGFTRSQRWQCRSVKFFDGSGG